MKVKNGRAPKPSIENLHFVVYMSLKTFPIREFKVTAVGSYEHAAEHCLIL